MRSLLSDDGGSKTEQTIQVGRQVVELGSCNQSEQTTGRGIMGAARQCFANGVGPFVS